MALAAAAMGMLNARGRFGVPALAPAVMNLVMVAAGLASIPVCRWWGRPAILAMAVGVVIGGLAQFAFQLPALASEGFRARIEPPRLHPGCCAWPGSWDRRRSVSPPRRSISW